MRWRPASRTWRWTLAGLGILVAGVLAAGAAVRWHGWWRWQRVQADIATAGLPMTVADLLRDQPPIDRGRQERLWRALQDWGAEAVAWRSPASPLSLRPPPDDPAMASALAAGSASMAALAALLDEGPVAISDAGWQTLDPRRWEDAYRSASSTAVRTTPLLEDRAAALWWSAAAARAADPAPALRRLDAWLDAHRHPLGVIDGMIAIALDAIRDETYCWLALQGRLAERDRLAWVAEPSQVRRWCADAWTGQRLVHLPAIAASARWEGWATLPWHWQACAAAVAETAVREARLRDLPAPPPCAPPPCRQALWVLMRPVDGVEEIVCEASFRHRLHRLAATLVAVWRRDGGLPADEAAMAGLAPAGVLAPRSPGEPAMRYERLGPERFRIGCDPAWPASAFPADADAAWRHRSDIGAPPSRCPLTIRRWSLELACDALPASSAP